MLIGFLVFIWGCWEFFVFEFLYDLIVFFKVNFFVFCFIVVIILFFINRYFGKKWSFFVVINGGLVGMVSCLIVRYICVCIFISYCKKKMMFYIRDI